MKTEDILARVLRTVEARWGGEPPPVSLKWNCPLSVKDNVDDERVFAHVLHVADTICLHPDFERLKDAHKCGILLHEIGHLFAGQHDAEADLWVDEQLGIEIKYKNMLQSVPVGKLEV